MAMHFIDISNWQHDIDLQSVLPNIDACVVKATEGTDYVNPMCDTWAQACMKAGKPWGFYHFAYSQDLEGARDEAEYFYQNCLGYFGKGVPILDWEGGQNVAWVNEFAERLHELCGMWPWIYANPWRFNQGGVNENCMRWVASYPAVTSPTFAQAESWDAPEAEGLVGAWQFCSDGRVGGYSGDLDCSLFYGDAKAWEAYYGRRDNGISGGADSGDSSGASSAGLPESQVTTLENDDFKVTIEVK